MRLNKTQLNQPATKDDILELKKESAMKANKQDVANLEQNLKSDISELKQELATKANKKDVANLEQNLKSDILELRKELATKVSKDDFDMAMIIVYQNFERLENKMDKKFTEADEKFDFLITGQDRLLKMMENYQVEMAANLAAHRRYENNFITINKKLKFA